MGALQHVVDRYQLYNTDPQHSASFSVPLLHAIVDSLRPAAAMQAGPVVSVFSCHDTNLLGLLYSLRDLGASYRQQGEGSTAGGLPEVISWPGFGEQDHTIPSIWTLLNLYYTLHRYQYSV